MNAKSIRLLQTALGLAPAQVTGVYDDATRAAVAAALTQNPPTGVDWAGWAESRRAVLCLQSLCARAGLMPGPLDGLWGPQTAYAAEQLVHLLAHGTPPAPWRLEPVSANPHSWPPERPEALEAFYGPPGETQLTTLALPYPLRLSWAPSSVVTQTRCHAKVKDSLACVLGRVLAEYGPARITELRLDLYGGGYNLRQKRGGTELSTHAWGIAFDFDPDHNQLKWSRARAAFARPEYDAWWRCWEDEGWVSLGRTRNYDWMHVQAARV